MNDTGTGRPLVLGYAGNLLRRGGENRGAEALAEALSNEAARVYLSRGAGWLHREGDADRPDFAFTVAQARDHGADLSEAILLGWTESDDAPRLAARLPAPAEGEPGDGAPNRDLRSLGMARVLDPDVEGQLAQAQHFLTWAGRVRFCGRCGTKTVPDAAGYRRRCPSCGEMHFPRTDPVTIMLIHDGGGNCLLGRQPHFAPGMFSCLAGFVEPGETMEQAVRRETMEEAGIRVGPVAYHSSQPWPFPGSLMIGCVGLAETREIAVDDTELEACRWFALEEVRAMLAGTHAEGLSVPHPFAIARHLIESFAGG